MLGQVFESRVGFPLVGKKALDVTDARLKIGSDFSAQDVSKKLVAQAEAEIREILCNGFSDSFFFFFQKGVMCSWSTFGPPPRTIMAI